MRKFVNSSIVLAFGVGLLIGCGEGEEALVSEGPDPTGTWLQGCIQDTDDDGDTEYAKEQMTFTDTAFTWNTLHYGETEGCADASLEWAISFTGTYETPSMPTPDDGGYAITDTFTGATITVSSSEILTHLNTGLCGKTDWEVGTAVDVTTLSGENCMWKIWYDAILESYNPMNRRYKIDGSNFLIEDDDAFDSTKAYVKQ